MLESDTNIILDCDTGEDDALAILVALQNKLPLHYVVTSHGNSTIENATQNTSRLLSYVGNRDVKVVRGSSHSMETHIHKPDGESAGDFVGKNGLCNVELPEAVISNIIAPNDSDFPYVLSKLIKTQAPVDYIITGPSTNFARACQFLGPNMKDYVKKVYVMGGALFEAGNSGPIDPNSNTQLAEFNFYCDPNAINIVLEAELPVHLITWDTTSRLTIPYSRVQVLQGNTPASEFSISLMKNFFVYYGLTHDRNFELNDPITVMAQMGYGKFKEERIRVKTTGTEYGRSIRDPDGNAVQYFYLDDTQSGEIVDIVLKTLDIQ